MYHQLFTNPVFRARRTAAAALSATLLVAAALPASHAQHSMMHSAGNDGGIVAETMPADDAVLATAPERIMLRFDDDVRLVKLTLRNPQRDMIDIGFRYDPRPDQQFMHPLPSLDSADYYIADWAVINDQERVVHGTFHFAFGPDAQPPSSIMEEMEEMRHIMAPDYRLQDPESELRIR